MKIEGSKKKCAERGSSQVTMHTVDPSGRHKVAALLLTFLLVVQVGIFGFQGKVKAMATVWDQATAQQYGLEKGADIVRVGLIGSATWGLISAVNFVAQKIAYDTATAISEGAPGKAPLFNPKGFGDYMKDTADEAAGFMIDALTNSGLAPFNLCDPGNARLNLALALSWADAQAPKKPSCKLTDMIKNYKTFAQRVKTGEALQQFSVAFQPAQSGLGASVDSSSKVLVQQMQKLNAALQDRLEGQGFTNLGDSITGKIKTPAQMIRAKALEVDGQAAAAKGVSYNALGQAIVAAPANIALGAANTFINHLVGALLTKALGKGLYYTLGDATCALGVTGCGGISDSGFGGNSEGAQAIRQQNADLITPPLQADNKYAPVEEFSSCPDEFRTVNNCAMDTQFASVLTRATSNGNKYLTVQEAIDQGYLHGEWPLISNSEAHRARNADPFCYTSGYCYSNLAKLRKHRILPIGWELAAAKSPDNPIKLNEVIARFNDCPTEADPNPANHPWCHLIDPNWILKLPATQCRMRVNGPTLLSADAAGRAQTCVDTPSCIGDDKFGNCTQGYGYCIREENIWRLGGTECQAPYASCASFNGRTGDKLLALQNTIDHGVCNANNVGCRPYNLVRTVASDTATWTYTPGKDRVFVNKDAADCDASGAGCTKVIDKEGLRRNLVINSSFEEATAQDGTADAKYWDRPVGSTSWTNDSQFARTGTHSMLLSTANAPDPSELLPIDPDMTYTLSFYARQGAENGTAAGIARVFLLSSLNNPDSKPVAVDLPADGITCTSGKSSYGGASVVAASFSVTPPGKDWTRTECTFVVPPNILKQGKVSYPKLLAIQFNKDVSGSPVDPIYIDDVQLEEGQFATDYHDSAYVYGEKSVQKTYKVPPQFLGCTGDKSVDPAACSNYAPVCQADEVGCDRYAPSAGGTPITAITTQQNACPSECVGYETFKKEASSYDVEEYPKYFIPTTATQCSATAAGCTEFTNLDTQQAGGEAREYFSYLRACEKPADQIPTYYTWEGSDTTGYQLKEWHLKSGSPLAASEIGNPPAVVAPYNPDLCTKDTFEKGISADCRQFFDVAGNVSYRLYSRTIVITADCHPFRITTPPVMTLIKDQNTCEGNKYHWIGGSNICVACESVGGTWSNETASCVFLGYKNESNSCQASENGCRLFSGNAGANVQVILDEGFETNDLAGWEIDPKFTATSTESTVVGGHSLRVKGTAFAARTFSSSTPPTIEANSLYTLQFWAKGVAGTIDTVYLRPNDIVGDAIQFVKKSDKVSLDSNWHLYSFGPVRSWSGTVGKEISLSFSATVPADSYWFIDNITLKKVGSAIAVVDRSWKTPLTCDQTTDGTYLPQAQLGCALYTDRKNVSHALKSFTTLCRDAAVGCRAYVNTENHDFIGYEYWNAMAITQSPVGSPTVVKDGDETLCTVATNNSSCRYHETTTVPATMARDTMVTCSRSGSGSCYIDGVYICEAKMTYGGCIVGQPCNKKATCTATPSDLVTVQPHKTEYLVDDDAYACDANQLGCTEVGVASGSICELDSKCVPGSTATSCPCLVRQEVCTPGKECTRPLVPVCNVAAGQKSCSYALPNNEPYLGVYQDSKNPLIDISKPNSSYNTKTIILDPSKYDQQICTGAAVGCDEWRSTNLNAPSLSYFKNPDGRECEYREDVDIKGVTYSGYFLQGTDSPCDQSFLIDGNYYGIRKSADANYHGYVGSCPANQASCTEYQDPNDTKFIATSSVVPAAKGSKNEDPLVEPKRYYYLKDQSIDYASCNGQVSKKDGCVLVNDTSDLNFSYNAAGTYTDSDNKNFALVPTKPGVCEYVTSCAVQEIPKDLGAGYLALSQQDQNEDPNTPGLTFSSHYKASKYFQKFDPSEVSKLCGPKDGWKLVLPESKVPDVRYQSGGCSSDADCGSSGYCNLQKPDANAVIKVQRDRICSQWYACKSSTPVWDSHDNRFRESCDEIGICDKSSAADSTSASVEIDQCKHWVIGAESTTILSEPVYAARETSWTGQEYSGYAVPHQYPASALASLPVGHFCVVPDAKTGEKISCKSSSECPVINEATGERSECALETSLGRDVGACYDIDGNSCDPGCGGMKSQQAWYACEKFSYPDVTKRTGSCYAGRCYQSPYGNPVGITQDAPQRLSLQSDIGHIPVSCRAYPEADSPVPTDVVTEWNSGGTAPFDFTVPLSIKQGFQNANVCQPGQDCECKYVKESFGQNARPKYFTTSQSFDAQYDGVCGGGDFDGSICDSSKQGVRSATNLSCGIGGTCQAATRKDSVRGLEGYCLERDLVTPIYGRQDGNQSFPARACLTWLPVDRISGQPDIFNQYKQATYELRDSYECMIPQLYKVIHTYGLGNDVSAGETIGKENDEGARLMTVVDNQQKVWVGCAAVNTTPGAQPSGVYNMFGDNQADLSVRGHGNPFLDCPPDTGFIVIDGEYASPGKYTETHSECEATGQGPGDSAKSLCDDGDNDFRYICVPWGSIHTSDKYGNVPGTECKPSDIPNGDADPDPCADDSPWAPSLRPAFAKLKDVPDNWGGTSGVQKNGDACANDEVIPKFNEKDWPQNSTPRNLMVQGGATYTVVVGDVCSNDVLGKMSDCWKIDAPVGSPGGKYDGALGHSYQDGLTEADIKPLLSTLKIEGTVSYPYYLGCAVVAQVSKGGDASQDTNKAWTDITGGSNADPPPGAGQDSLETANKETDYNWNTTPTPFGGGVLRGLANIKSKTPFETVDIKDDFVPGNPPNWKDGKKPKPYVFVSRSGGSICDTDAGGCYGYGSDDNATGIYNNGASYIHQIFRRMYGYFGWNYVPDANGNTGYQSLPAYLASNDPYRFKDFSTYDLLMNSSAGKSIFSELWRDLSTVPNAKLNESNVPRLIGVSSCDVDGHCYEDPATQMTVNGKASGDVIGGGGWKRVIFKFFATAGNSADPIRDVRVIWDVNAKNLSPTTGTSGKFLGLFKNHRGYVNLGGIQKSACNAQNFGTTEDACDDSGPFTFIHNYTCGKTSPHCEDGTDNCFQPYLPPGQKEMVMACQYKPAVYVLNNWGLCTGTCGKPGSVPAGELCSNNGGSSDTIPNGNPDITKTKDALVDELYKDECRIFTDAVANGNVPWVPYSGTVVVFPED